MPGIAREMTLSELSAALGEQAERLQRLDLSRPLKVIAVAAKSDFKENFQGSHDPEGNPWKPLQRPRSRKRDRRKGRKGSDKPLLDTGLLQASVSAKGASHVEDVSASSLEVGSALSYAAYQDQGTRTIPARPFIGFSDSLLQTIEDVLLDHLEQQL